MSARVMLVACSLATAALGGYHSAPLLLRGVDMRAYLPGATSPGHRSFEAACEACHTPFRGVTNDACRRCHGEALEAAMDSHPEGKFTDPRNAERVAGLDARACVTCHREHVPDRTRAIGVTQPADLCAACHADIGRDRPSHAAFPLDGCARNGCHHFHDNRSLYEAYLGAHLGEPDNLQQAVVPRLTPLASATRALGAADADAPAHARTDETVREWAATAHAAAGVNCTACHEVRAATGRAEWRDRPGSASCGGCHAGEREGFLRSAHGVREAVGLSPLTPAMARLPMKADAAAHTLGCESCHGAHAYDTRRAAVDACLGCHDDAHSRGYTSSRHAVARRREQSGAAPAGSGVSCATCHLPRLARRWAGADEVRATHDVSAALRPRDKMIRAACSRCHGLGFAIDALADDALVGRGLNGRPTAHVQSLSMVEARRAGEAQRGGDK